MIMNILDILLQSPIFQQPHYPTQVVDVEYEDLSDQQTETITSETEIIEEIEAEELN